MLLDCRDNSCDFAIDKTGQRTNGGCRCLNSLQDLSPNDRVKLRTHLRELNKEIRDLRIKVDYLIES